MMSDIDGIKRAMSTWYALGWVYLDTNNPELHHGACRLWHEWRPKHYPLYGMSVIAAGCEMRAWRQWRERHAGG